ncbi:hypothetical protein FBU30_000835 [Linnemannia zychae]|nr:hypothetical protein FBU30_000835 [Linnemannia zychae]
MHFFKKSNKNKTASAASSPIHTPRVSIDESRLINIAAKQKKQPQDAEMLHKLMAQAISGGHSAMPSFFSKSSSTKNQTASADNTPAPTPRNSVHEQRIGQSKMTHDEALLLILQKSMSNAAAGHYVR